MQAAEREEMKVGIVLDRLFARHVAPRGHPERPERIEAVADALETWGGFGELEPSPVCDAEETSILAVHTRGHFERIKATAGGGFHQFDPDTYASSESFATALKAAGSVIRLTERVIEGEVHAGFAAVRPPGHHAESNRAMGFCLFNNIAVAAQAAIERGLAQKIAIVDFDVHHGNGTQEIFYSRPDVLYISSHQYPFYPGTGHFSEAGAGDGHGFTVNFPIQAGMGDHFYCSLYRHFVVPIIRQFSPGLLLVSAGYDAHRYDPLAGMQLETEGFGELSNLLNGVAAEVCDGRIVYVLEGGYNLEALGEAVRTTIATTVKRQEFEIAQRQEADYAAYRSQMRREFSRYWEI